MSGAACNQQLGSSFIDNAVTWSAWRGDLQTALTLTRHPWSLTVPVCARLGRSQLSVLVAAGYAMRRIPPPPPLQTNLTPGETHSSLINFKLEHYKVSLFWMKPPVSVLEYYKYMSVQELRSNSILFRTLEIKDKK